jgi:hypothetical protein
MAGLSCPLVTLVRRVRKTRRRSSTSGIVWRCRSNNELFRYKGVRLSHSCRTLGSERGLVPKASPHGTVHEASNDLEAAIRPDGRAKHLPSYFILKLDRRALQVTGGSRRHRHMPPRNGSRSHDSRTIEGSSLRPRSRRGCLVCRSDRPECPPSSRTRKKPAVCRQPSGCLATPMR